MAAASACPASSGESNIRARKSVLTTDKPRRLRHFQEAAQLFFDGADFGYARRRHNLTEAQLEKALRAAYVAEQRSGAAVLMHLEAIAPEQAAEFRAEQVDLAEEIWADCERPLLGRRGIPWKPVASAVALGLAGLVIFHDDLCGLLIGGLPALRPLARAIAARSLPALKVAARSAAKYGPQLAMWMPRALGRDRRTAA